MLKRPQVFSSFLFILSCEVQNDDAVSRKFSQKKAANPQLSHVSHIYFIVVHPCISLIIWQFYFYFRSFIIYNFDYVHIYSLPISFNNIQLYVLFIEIINFLFLNLNVFLCICTFYFPSSNFMQNSLLIPWICFISLQLVLLRKL